jgi:hypothetical protein
MTHRANLLLATSRWLGLIYRSLSHTHGRRQPVSPWFLVGGLLFEINQLRELVEILGVYRWKEAANPCRNASRACQEIWTVCVRLLTE